MVIFIIIFAAAIIAYLLYALYKTGGKPTHAGGIVYKKDKGLLLFLIVTAAANKKKWVLPKGRVETGELPAVAAVREVKEESGVTAKVIKKTGQLRYNDAKKAVIAYFLMEFERFDDTSSENRKVAWVEKAEAIKKIGSGRLKNMIKRVKIN